jgi:hypothetical protein
MNETIIILGELETVVKGTGIACLKALAWRD